MKYMLLIYGAEDCWTEDERKACMVESLGICDELAARGSTIGASPLQSVTTAASVRVRDGRTLVTDGPFAETTEQLGGYYVLDLADLDEAIAVAAAAARRQGDRRDPPAPRPGRAAAGPPVADRRGRRARAPRSCCSATTTRRPGRPRGPRRSPRPGRRPRPSPGGSRTRAGISARPRSTRRRRPRASACGAAGASITDGPFAETHEVLGGYYLILAEDRATAVRFAAQHPARGSAPSRCARCSTCPGSENRPEKSGGVCRFPLPRFDYLASVTTAAGGRRVTRPTTPNKRGKTMTGTTITPYLFFGGRCEEALEFYRKALGAEVEMVMRFDESPTPPPPGVLQPGFEKKVMHASFRVRGVPLMASDGLRR